MYGHDFSHCWVMGMFRNVDWTSRYLLDAEQKIGLEEIAGYPVRGVG